jgi:hypothetical protein
MNRPIVESASLRVFVLGGFALFLATCKSEPVSIIQPHPVTLSIQGRLDKLQENTTDNSQENATIYVAGFTSSSQHTDSNATFWRDGMMETLQAMVATSVCFAGTDVYVTGYTSAVVNQVAKYWKNGTEIILPSEGPAISTSIVVSGSDVYVAGYGDSGAMYWKNGQPVYLSASDSASTSIASSIFVSGSDVFIAGLVLTKKNNQFPTYWKNGEINWLNASPRHSNGGLYGNATSIYVSGSNVYVAGRITGENFAQVAVYWKNGVTTKLDSGSSYASSVYVSENDVYVGGFNNQGGVYWKNGTAVNLAPASAVNSIFVTGNDVYACGYAMTESMSNTVGVYWKNGNPTYLNGPSDANALSISVVNKEPVP